MVSHDSQAWLQSQGIAPGALNFDFVRSSGPGGQNVNKRSTRAVLTVVLDDLRPALSEPAMARLRCVARRWLTEDDRIIIERQTHRTQLANRRACLDRLVELIRRARQRPTPRKATRPTRASQQRRLAQKRQRSEIKRQRQRKQGDD